jgi:hypothetical protein
MPRWWPAKANSPTCPYRCFRSMRTPLSRGPARRTLTGHTREWGFLQELNAHPKSCIHLSSISDKANSCHNGSARAPVQRQKSAPQPARNPGQRRRRPHGEDDAARRETDLRMPQRLTRSPRKPQPCWTEQRKHDTRACVLNKALDDGRRWIGPAHPLDEQAHRHAGPKSPPDPVA